MHDLLHALKIEIIRFTEFLPLLLRLVLLVLFVYMQICDEIPIGLVGEGALCGSGKILFSGREKERCFRRKERHGDKDLLNRSVSSALWMAEVFGLVMNGKCS
jgi:hypothetical protein